MEFFKKYWGVLVIVAVLVVAGGWWQYANQQQREGIGHETGLTAQYRNGQNELSTYYYTYAETIGIPDRAVAQMKDVIVGAIQQRGPTTMGNGTLVNALAEAYPDISTIPGLYDKVFDMIQTGRAKFANQQTALLSRIQEYDTWRHGGILRSWAVGNFFPSDNLKAYVGNELRGTGQKAYDQMNVLVLAEASTGAFDKGTMAPLAPPPLPSATPAPTPAPAPPQQPQQ